MKLPNKLAITLWTLATCTVLPTATYADATGHNAGSITGFAKAGNMNSEQGADPASSVGWLTLFLETARGREKLATRRPNLDGSFGFSALQVPANYIARYEVEGFDRIERPVALTLVSPRIASLELAAPERSQSKESFEGGSLWEFESLLARFAEPDLCSGGTPNEHQSHYRMIWLRDGFPNIFLKLSMSADEVKAVYKEATQQSVATEPLSLNPASSSLTAFSELAQASFWNQPFRIEQPPHSQLQASASTWVIEGRSKGICHLVYRGNPTASSPVRLFGQQLLFQLAGKRFFYDEVF